MIDRSIYINITIALVKALPHMSHGEWETLSNAANAIKTAHADMQLSGTIEPIDVHKVAATYYALKAATNDFIQLFKKAAILGGMSQTEIDQTMSVLSSDFEKLSAYEPALDNILSEASGVSKD